MKTRNAIFSVTLIIVLSVHLTLVTSECHSETYYGRILPLPKQIIPQSGFFLLDNHIGIILAERAGQTEWRVAEDLAEAIMEKTGAPCRVESDDKKNSNSAQKPIFIELKERKRKFNHEDGSERTNQKGGYRLSIETGKISIQAEDLEGTRNGMLTLIQIIANSTGGTTGNAVLIPCMSINDSPRFLFRGLHLQLWPVVNVSYVKKTINMAAKVKFNSIIFEMNKGYQYSKHPEIADKNAYTKEQMTDLVQYCRERGMLPIPAINSFGHQEQLLRDSHPELVLQPPRNVDQKASQWYRKTLDTSKPDVYRILFNLYAELIEIFRSPYFLIGCDEVEGLRWQNNPNGDRIFAEHVTRLHDFLATRGIKTMMWDDMLLEIKEKYESSVNRRPITNIYRAIDLIPKNIVILDWYHSRMPGYEFNAIAFLSQKDLLVIRSTFTDSEGIIYHSREAARAGDRVLGMLATLWYNLTEGKDESIEATIKTSGEYFWNGAHEVN